MNEPCGLAEPFIETLEYRRFAEFCDACRHYRYIGLCFGVPGVGKTLSARHYARWDDLEGVDVYGLPDEQLEVLGQPATIFYTADVVNTPRGIRDDIGRERARLHRIVREPIHRAKGAKFNELGAEYNRKRDAYLDEVDWFDPKRPPPPAEPPYAKLSSEFYEQEMAIEAPTSLIVIDEADRLKMASLEATRDLFDKHHIGLILIGMPGIEKRMARYPQLYSRIGFVHEFRPLRAAEVRRLLDEGWRPPGMTLKPVDEESVASIVRITGGNFRLLHRLLAQAERIACINQLDGITPQVVEAARESLVIGQT
jgi:DNA transposition AAA+ family ATPase